jgi:hypothetical protein
VLPPPLSRTRPIRKDKGAPVFPVTSFLSLPYLYPVSALVDRALRSRSRSRSPLFRDFCAFCWSVHWSVCCVFVFVLCVVCCVLFVVCVCGPLPPLSVCLPVCLSVLPFSLRPLRPVRLSVRIRFGFVSFQQYRPPSRSLATPSSGTSRTQRTAQHSTHAPGRGTDCVSADCLPCTRAHSRPRAPTDQMIGLHSSMSGVRPASPTHPLVSGSPAGLHRPPPVSCLSRGGGARGRLTALDRSTRTMALDECEWTDGGGLTGPFRRFRRFRRRRRSNDDLRV